MSDDPAPRRYFLRVSYHGGGFAGWQRQTRGRTVQGTLEEAIARLLGRHAPAPGPEGVAVPVTAAGRTDAGVHATGQIIHVDLPAVLHEPGGPLTTDQGREKWRHHLERMLPPDLAVGAMWPVPADAHARYGALYREYRYHLHLHRDVHRQGLSTLLHRPPDVAAMQACLDHTLGRHDFQSVSKAMPEGQHYRCQMMAAEVLDDAPTAGGHPAWQVRLRADRFTRGMVRAIMAVVLRAGDGRISPDTMADLLAHPRPELSYSLAPPDGLYLHDVGYPDAWGIGRLAGF